MCWDYILLRVKVFPLFRYFAIPLFSSDGYAVHNLLRCIYICLLSTMQYICQGRRTKMESAEGSGPQGRCGPIGRSERTNPRIIGKGLRSVGYRLDTEVKVRRRSQRRVSSLEG